MSTSRRSSTRVMCVTARRNPEARERITLRWRSTSSSAGQRLATVAKRRSSTAIRVGSSTRQEAVHPDIDCAWYSSHGLSRSPLPSSSAQTPLPRRSSWAISPSRTSRPTWALSSGRSKASSHGPGSSVTTSATA